MSRTELARLFRLAARNPVTRQMTLSVSLITSLVEGHVNIYQCLQKLLCAIPVFACSHGSYHVLLVYKIGKSEVICQQTEIVAGVLTKHALVALLDLGCLRFQHLEP